MVGGELPLIRRDQFTGIGAPRGFEEQGTLAQKKPGDKVFWEEKG